MALASRPERRMLLSWPLPPLLLLLLLRQCMSFRAEWSAGSMCKEAATAQPE